MNISISIAYVKTTFFSLADHWRDSIGFLSVTNSKNLVLLTLNTFLHSGILILKWFNWLVIGAFIGTVFSDYVPVLSFCILALLLYVFIASIRPSVRIKNMDYFMWYARHFPYFLAMICLYVMLEFGITFLFYSIGLPEWLLLISKQILCVFNSLLSLWYVISPIVVYAGFCFFDKEASFYTVFFSLYVGIKMTWYSLPFSLIVATSFAGISVGINTLLFSMTSHQVHIIPMIISAGITMLLWFLFVCLLSVYYIKKAHEHYELYFNNNAAVPD